MKKRGLVWFKNDLRIQDNETLRKAIAENEEVLCVYCFDDEMLEQVYPGIKKMGPFRLQFLRESLEQLDKNLRRLGSGLMMLTGKPENSLVESVQQYNIETVYTQYEPAPEELATLNRVKDRLEELSVPVKTFVTDTLLDYLKLPFTADKLPDIFTEFRKKAEKADACIAPLPAPEHIASPEIPPFVFRVTDTESEKIYNNRPAHRWRGGEDEGLRRMHYYYSESGLISSYKETRNGLLGEDYSSKFSPWLSIGCVSPRTLYAELKVYEQQKGANESTYWLYFELLWREYFRLLFYKYPVQFFWKKGIKPFAPKTRFHAETFEKWKTGNTGNAFIDANMRELNLTGFMSNRGRQNVASYLCHNLHIDFRYGAAYFEERLIDYDVYNNWGNWAYVAGVGNDPRPNRIFNIEKQADMYDPEGLFSAYWMEKSID